MIELLMLATVPSTPAGPATVEVMKLVAGGGVGVALIVVIYLFLRDRRNEKDGYHVLLEGQQAFQREMTDKMDEALGKVAGAIDRISQRQFEQQEKNQEYFQRITEKQSKLMTQVVVTVASQEKTVASVLSSVEAQNRTVTGLTAAVQKLETLYQQIINKGS